MILEIKKKEGESIRKFTNSSRYTKTPIYIKN